MKCPKCNNDNTDGSKFCLNCGSPLSQENNNQKSGGSGLAVASLVLGIIGLIFTFVVIGIIPAIIGLILGIVALATKKPKKGMSIAGIVLSTLSILILVGIMSLIPSENNDNNVAEVQEETEEEDAKENIQSDEELIQEGAEPQNESSSELGVGSYFETEGLKITINDANLDFTEYDDEYGLYTPEDGMKYIMVSFTFENIGDSDEYVSIYDFACYADNTACEQAYLPDGSAFMNTNLSPGRNVSFSTYYTVPIDAQSIELEYETNLWTGEKATIVIQ